MRGIATFIAGAIGLFFWAYLVVQAGESLREDPVDYNIEDLDVPDPSELDLPRSGLCRRMWARPDGGAANGSRDRAGRLWLARLCRHGRSGTRRSAGSAVAEREARAADGRSPTSPLQSLGRCRRLRPRSARAACRPRRNAGGPQLYRRGRFFLAVWRHRAHPTAAFLRNRSLACETSAAGWQGEIRTRCWVGMQDVSSWLAKYGWAEAEPDSALAPLTDEARLARRGLFGEPER